MARWALTPAVLLGLATMAVACPFCTAVKPSLAQRVDDAERAALVEVSHVTPAARSFTVRKPLAGADHFDATKDLTLEAEKLTGAGPLKVGQLALLLATRAGVDQDLAWEAIPLDEVGFAYIARAPSRRRPAAERLPYYARFLEHPHPLLAEDAYLEFGNASYDEVAQVAADLPFARLRRWITDPQIPEARQGFYGLALGLAATDEDCRANEHVLRRLIDAKADDFRAGFDGILGGYLVLTGPAGLRHIDERLLSNPQARHGDLRHAATALRFMHEFGRDAIPQADLSRAMRRLLARPELAAPAIVDLARWQDWEPLDRIAALFSRPEYSDAATSRAIVGYLKACPRPEASEALARLRRLDPQRVAAAEQASLLPATTQ
jgi:hypothetical protein